MSIPDYQTLMLPLLKRISDGGEYKFRDLIDLLASDFNLAPEERKELLPSGQQALFDNRVGWAKTYMKKAGLLDSPKRGVVVITPEGQNILRQNLNSIDTKFLRKYLLS